MALAYLQTHKRGDNLLGSPSWKGRLDLLNIVLIGIDNKLPMQEEKYELHRLLCTLLSIDLSADEKLKIMEKEYDILVDDKMREDVSAMCNLSQPVVLVIVKNCMV